MSPSLPVSYRNAEDRYRTAATADDRRSALEEMLAELPRSLATAELQADLRRRLERLRQQAERRAAPRTAHVHVEPDGAAQVVLLGAPNSGKSSLLAALTPAQPTIADYPFATTRPQAGMMQFEDLSIQLVDLPPVTADSMEPWLPDVVRLADAALLVADPSTPGVLTGIEEVCDRLAAAGVELTGELPADLADGPLAVRTLLVVAKTDAAGEDDLATLEELYGDRFPTVRCSTAKRVGLQQLKLGIWRQLHRVRVHLKTAGAKDERSRPLVLPAGATVADLADVVEHGLARRLVAARVWGGQVQGQRVAKDFELRDRDLVELAT